jgi:hypothetical protein
MVASLQRLLAGAIDYAGLFPPAKLDMQPAMENYRRYQAGKEAWIVNRFICPAARLGELPDAGLSISVIGSANQDRGSWEMALEQDSQAMNDLLLRTPSNEIEGYEVRIPSHRELSQCIRDLKGFSETEVYVELPWGQEMGDSLHALSESEWLGAKARTGGITPESFPSPEQLAEFLHTCYSLDLDFKLTAGLHHPFRSYRDEVKAEMHGFLNVLVASALIFAEDVPRSVVKEILEEQDPKAFEFSNEGIRWRDHGAGLHDIEEARDRFVGFGSCSVEEPLEDLASEGLS